MLTENQPFKLHFDLWSLKAFPNCCSTLMKSLSNKINSTLNSIQFNSALFI